MEDTKLRLPLTRVKKIAKMNLAYNISADAAKLLTLATEKYVELMGKCSWNWALANSRKTIQIADIAQCVQRDWMFAILEDALENWPDESSVPIADGAGEEAAAIGSEAENSADENEAIYDGNEDVDVAEMDESFQHEAQIDNDNEHDVVESRIDLPINSLPKDIEDL